MLVKKSVYIGDKSNVRFVNGVVSFSSVKLNVYCFETDGVLIDTGAQTLLPEFKPFFAKVNVDQVALTHAHEDHTGGARYIQETYGVPIYMSEKTKDESTQRAAYPLYRKLFWGKRQPFSAQPLGETFESRHAHWDVIETPGHTKDHLSFLNRETGQLFSGDLYVNPKTKVVLQEESMPSIMQSIERVLTYDFDEVFCCHAGYVKNGRQALTDKLDNLKELETRVLSLHQQGLNNKEIQKKVFEKKYPITFFSMGEWDTKHVVDSFIREKSRLV